MAIFIRPFTNHHFAVLSYVNWTVNREINYLDVYSGKLQWYKNCDITSACNSGLNFVVKTFKDYIRNRLLELTRT